RRVVGRAFVKHHGNVRAEDALDFHRFLRAEEERRAVEVRSELYAVRFDLPDFGEAENLEAAAVSEDGQFPVHEPVQAAGGAEDVQAGPDVEMIGVAKDDLRAHLDEFT